MTTPAGDEKRDCECRRGGYLVSELKFLADAALSFSEYLQCTVFLMLVGDGRG